MAEVVTLAQVHVEHGDKGRGDNEVEDPLKRHGNGCGLTTDGVGEEFGHVDPADGAPREHKAGRIDHDGEHRDGAQGCVAKGQGHAESANGHADGTADEQRFAPEALHREHSDERETDVDHAHDDGLHHRIVHTHVGKDTRRVVEHGVDARQSAERRRA